MKKILSTLAVLLTIAVSTFAQSGSFGSAYTASGGEMAIFSQHNFQNGSGTISAGIIATQRVAPTGLFSWAGTGSWLNAANNAFVDGYARTYLVGAFVFPIGDNSTYRPAAVSTASAANPATAAYYAADPSIAITSNVAGGNHPALPAGAAFSRSQKTVSLKAIDSVEYWDIDGSTPAKITLTWNAATNVNALTGGNLPYLTISGWDGTKWVPIPSTIDANQLLQTQSNSSFTGAVSNVTTGSITTNATVLPSAYTVYTLASNYCASPGNPSIAVNMGTNPICKNGTVQLCPTVWGWSNYQWYKNGVAIAAPTGTSACITLDSTGVGTYELVAFNGTCPSNTTAVTVTYNSNCITGTVTSGGTGGLESKTLGNILAQRLYGNAKDSKTEVDGKTTGTKYANSGVVVNGISDISLSTLIPTTVVGTDAAYNSTPTDLVNFTNAVDVLAVDYTQGSSIKAVAFGTKTLGDVYSHTKPICDRLKGAQLLEVKPMQVGSYSLMAYKVQQCTGEVEYAMNLSAGTSANRSSISLQSNWFTDSYVSDENLYNFQLWAVSYDMVKGLAQNIINTLQANGTVTTVSIADAPKAYVSTGSRQGNKVTLNINNNTTATTAVVELKEKATETALETTRQLPVTIAANNTSTVTIDVKDNYEATINLLLNNIKTDMLYLNDGTWALDYNKNNTSVNSFVVSNDNATVNTADEYRLLRNVNIAATSKDYVTAYKTIGTKCQSLHLGNYNSLKFKTASTGASSVTITLISSNITDWKDQYSTTISLDGRSTDYTTSLSSFASTKYATSVQGNNITGVSFAFNTSRGVPTNVSVALSNARFSKEVATTAASNNIVLGVYPNPSNGMFTASYNSASAQSLVLKVVEAATGRVVKTMFVTAVKGNNQTKVQLQNQASGNYFVTLEGDEVKYTPAKVMMNK